MATIKNDLVHIPKFDGSNFQIWKFSISIVLKSEKLVSVVNGTEKEPEDRSKKEWQTWDEKDSRAQVIFLTTVKEDQMQCLVNCNSAAAMWTKLISIHEQKTEVSRELIWQKFYEYRMSDGDKISQHISKIENLVKQLKDINEQISNSAMCSKIISSLPQKYNNFKTAWDSVTPEQQTFENLAARLLKEEVRMTVTESESEKLALQVQALQTKLKSFENKNKENGHDQKKFQNIAERKKTSSCNYCKKRGHWARECRRRIADESTKKNESKNSYLCDVSDLYSLSSDRSGTEWICDSGASVHMTNQKNWFTKLDPLTKPVLIKIANDKVLEGIGVGSINIQARANGKWHNRVIQNVFYIPELSRSLFSVGAMTDKNFSYTSTKNICEFKDQDGELSCVGHRSGNLWIMDFRMMPPISDCNIAKSESLKLWHDRLGHINFKAIKAAHRSNAVNGLEIDDSDEVFCEACQFGKQSRKPHPSVRREKAEKPGEMVHSDVCGPMSVPSPSGSRYFVIFKDDCTNFTTVYFIKHKSEVFSRFKDYEAFVRTQTGNSIKTIRCDNGTEYVNKDFQNFLRLKGIIQELSAPYIHEGNGRSEREIRTIVESARSMIFNKNVSTELWSEAVNTAVYVLNRSLSSQSDGKSAYEKWFKRKPDLKHLRVFGSTAYMFVPPQLRKKWEPKSKQLIFVGYDGNSTNYRLWNTRRRKIEVSSNVTFNEKQTRELTEESKNENDAVVKLSFGNYEIYEDGEEEKEVEDEEEQFINEEKQTIIENDTSSSPTSRIDSTDSQEVAERQLRDRSTISRPNFYEAGYLTEVDVPESYEKAINCDKSVEWTKAMLEEMEALKINQTWNLVPLPRDAPVVKSKWVYKVKMDLAGNVTRYKARLVAKGFTQQAGIDYNETFAPVVRYDSLRTLLALTAMQDYEMIQFDVKTAFLYGDLKETIYMEQPKGFENRNHPDHVCQLKKSLYGLKQAPRCWNLKFITILSDFQMKQLKSDNCVFVGSDDGVPIYLTLYVDDGLVMSFSKAVIEKLLTCLKENFQITISEVKQYIGLEIVRNREKKTITLTQRGYVNRIFENV